MVDRHQRYCPALITTDEEAFLRLVGIYALSFVVRTPLQHGQIGYTALVFDGPIRSILLDAVHPNNREAFEKKLADKTNTLVVDGYLRD